MGISSFLAFKPVQTKKLDDGTKRVSIFIFSYDYQLNYNPGFALTEPF